MKNHNLSDTYMYLYDYIIGDLLSQICADNRFCVKNAEIPFIIGEKFDEYRLRASKKMSKDRLDRHKLASCICGAIIETRPLIGYNRAAIPKNANEVFALYTGLAVIKYYMMYSSICSTNMPSEIQEQVLKHFRENFSLRFPDFSKNICDEQSYENNLINCLYWSHHQCNAANKECFCFDIWAYAKIYYHLELYNLPYFAKAFQEYMRPFRGNSE